MIVLYHALQACRYAAGEWIDSRSWLLVLEGLGGDLFDAHGCVGRQEVMEQES